MFKTSPTTGHRCPRHTYTSPAIGVYYCIGHPRTLSRRCVNCVLCVEGRDWPSGGHPSKALYYKDTQRIAASTRTMHQFTRSRSSQHDTLAVCTSSKETNDVFSSLDHQRTFSSTTETHSKAPAGPASTYRSLSASSNTTYDVPNRKDPDSRLFPPD